LQTENSNFLNKPDNEIIDVIVDEVRKALGHNESSMISDAPYPLIPLGVSNHHIHLTPEMFVNLFGEEVEFETDRPLYQPGEFASKHALTIVGPKMRSIPGVRILGPLRKYDQVEISLSDAIFLGVNAPVKRSGDLKDAGALTLVGPEGSVFIEHCAIVANRHIHMTGDHARIFDVTDGDFCRVRIGGEKSTIFEHVLIRVNDAWKLQIHLDTDDANAAYVRGETEVEFINKMKV
jgi:putative phosphotransacetylase